MIAFASAKVGLSIKDNLSVVLIKTFPESKGFGFDHL
jgi:hypothetical protein